jgi:hypothetical protein
VALGNSLAPLIKQLRKRKEVRNMTTDSFIERAQDIIESVYEYETTHQDAGDNYSHLANEGDFDYHNGETRLQEYCAEMGIDLAGIEIDRLAEDVIFWGYMTQGADYDPKKRFLVSSYSVGEIETQVECEEIGARFTPYLIKKLNRETDGFWRYSSPDVAYCYINTDSYWDHVCDLDTIRDLVKAMKEES